MGIPLFNLMNNTPDRVRSLDSSSSNGEGRIFTWCLRDKNKPGLNVKLLSIPTTNGGSEWEVRIHRVEWSGTEFIENDEPLRCYSHETSEEAISCAKREIQDICDNNEELKHCINFLRN